MSGRAGRTPCPCFRALLGRRTRNAVPFAKGVVIELHKFSYRTARGYALAGVIADECAF